jgi:hypothetical protein
MGDEAVLVSSCDVLTSSFLALGVSVDALDVVVFVFVLYFIEAAAVVVVSKKFGPDIKGSM